MAIKITGRSLNIPISDRIVGHEGDNLIETRTFELNRYYSNIDMSVFDFKLDTQVGDVKNTIDLDKTVSEDKIILIWNIAESHLLHSGYMSIQLRAFSGNEEKWHSAQDYVRVQPSINAAAAIPDPLPSEFVQMEQRVTAAKNEAIEAAQEAKQQAERVEDIIQEAEQDVLPELRQAIEDGIETKDQLGGSIQEAGETKTALDGSISSAGTAKGELDGSITEANTAKGQLDDSIDLAGNAKTELDGSITAAGQIKEQLDESIATGDIAAFRAEFESHKNDFATYKDSNNLKIAKIEKELNNYQQTMSGININQEPTQQATGYGMVSLPKNAANGQFSNVRILGNTATNIVKNGSFEEGKTGWLTSGYQSEFEVIDGYAKTTSATHKFKGFLQYCSLQQNDKYYVRFKTKVDDYTKLIAARIIYGLLLSDGYTNFTLDNNNWATKSVIFQKISESNAIRFYYEFNETSVISAYLDDVLLINLTKEGLENKTKEELDAMFSSYFTGTKSTISAMRLKSVGKNLFDGGFVQGYWATSDIQPHLQRFTLAHPIKVQYNASYAISGLTLNSTNGYAHFARFLDENKTVISDAVWSTSGVITVPNNPAIKYMTLNFYCAVDGVQQTITPSLYPSQLQIEKGTVATSYEPYTESTAYIPNVGELRSLPNGTKDELRDDGKKIQRVSEKYILNGSEPWILQSINGHGIANFQLSVGTVYELFPNIIKGVSGVSKQGAIVVGNFVQQTTAIADTTVEGFFYNASDNLFIRIQASKLTTQDVVGFKTWLTANPQTVIYQLATPIEIPIEVSGTLLSYPSGTVYIEPIIADAGVYTDKMTVLNTDAPIKSLDKLSVIDFLTGVETELDVSQAVIAVDGLSFTHPELANGDIVFFEYEYEYDGTVPEIEAEYYDSRIVKEDKSVPGKFYKIEFEVNNGVVTPIAVEV